MQNLKPCPYRQVDDEGHILCAKIKSGDREVSPNVCRACPVSAINCAHLRATLDHQTRPPITVRYGNGKTEVWEDVAPSISLHRAACAVKVTPILSPRDCAGCPLRQALIAPDAIAVRPPAQPGPVLTPKPATDRPTAPHVAASSVRAPRPRDAAAAQRNTARPPQPAPPAPGPRTVAPVQSQVNQKPQSTRTAPVRQTRAPASAPVAPAHARVAEQPTATSAPPQAPQAATAPASQAEQQRSSMVAKKIIQLQEWLEKQKTAPRPPAELESTEENPLPRAAAAGMSSPPRPTRLEEKRVGWTD